MHTGCAERRGTEGKAACFSRRKKEQRKGTEEQREDSYRYEGMTLRMAGVSWWVMAPYSDQGYDAVRTES